MSAPDRLRRNWWPSTLLLFALIGGGILAYTLILLHGESGQIKDLNSSNQQRDNQVNTLAGAVNSARAQISSLGATPVVPAPSQILKTIQVSGPAGAQGPGPSDAQVEAAVSAYLAAHPVPGVSNAQVASAVDAYFAASPAPSGPQGPGPSQQQIADAVASYMAANPAPSGPSGPAGSPGASGVGATGPQGVQGNPGQSGAAGSPPAGWSYTDPLGNAYTCVPDSATPAPNYTCAPVAPSSSASSSPTGTASTAAGANPADARRNTASSSHPATPTASATATSPSPSPSNTSPSPTTPISHVLAALAAPVLRREDLFNLGG